MRSAARGAARWRRRAWCRFRREILERNFGEKGEGEMSETNIQEVVKQKYGQAAKQVTEGGTASCGGRAELSCCDPITKNLYGEAEKSGLPADAAGGSLGCGNPTPLVKFTG